VRIGLLGEIAPETANSPAGELKTSVSHECTPQDATKHNTVIHEWSSLSLRGNGTCNSSGVCAMLRAMKHSNGNGRVLSQPSRACTLPEGLEA